MTVIIERALPDTAERAEADARMRELLTGPGAGPVAERLALLHFTGRRSGRPYTVPAGVHRLGDRLVVATGSAWRHNFTGGAPGELTWRGERRAARFVLLTDAAATARGYLELYERYGAQAPRRLGITVRGQTPPGPDDFRDAVGRCGLSLVEVRLRVPRGDETVPCALPASNDSDERTPR